MQVSLMATAMNPYTRHLAEDTFKALGVDLDPQTYSLVTQLENKTQERIHYETMGDQFSANNAKGEEGKIMQNILAKFAPILAKGSQMIMKSRNGDVPDPTRPVPNGNGYAIAPENSPFRLPPGVQPGSLAATKLNWERATGMKA
jgi:hypothetical protein